MSNIPTWLTDEGVERIIALGREMETFVLRRAHAKAADPNAKVAPHPELFALIAAIQSNDKRKNAPIEE